MNINPKQMKFSIRKISMLVAIATLPVSLRAQEIPIYRDASKPIEERIDDALSRMTLEEKSDCFMLTGATVRQVFQD